MPGMSSMQDLFDKVKQAAALPTNLDESVKGRMQMREDAPDRPSSGLGVPWGEGQLQSAPPSYSNAVERELVEGRSKLLECVFEGTASMAATDKAHLQALFQNFNGPATTSHSPLLQKKASHVPPPTLAEAVRALR